MAKDTVEVPTQYDVNQETTNEKNQAENNKKYRQALLLAALILLTVASAAVLTAIFAPDIMPEVIQQAVNNLKDMNRLYQAIIILTCAVGAVSFLGAGYTGASMSGCKPSLNLCFFNEKKDSSYQNMSEERLSGDDTPFSSHDAKPV